MTPLPRLWPLLVSLILVPAVSGCSGATKEVSSPQTPVSGPEGHFERGLEAFRTGDSVRAEQYFVVALEQGYDEAKVLPWLLRSCLRNARLRSALSYGEPYLQKHPEEDELRILVATLRLSLGQKGAALRHTKQLLRRDAANAEAHYLAGLAEPASSTTAEVHLDEYLRLAPSGEHASEVENLLAEWREERASTHELSQLEAPHDPD